jgi:hypothetical protein
LGVVSHDLRLFDHFTVHYVTYTTLTDDPLATMRLTASEVLLERIGMRLQRVILSGLQFTTSAALLCGALSAAFAADKPATSVATRVATFETGAGDRFFAASIQPSADPALLKQLRSRPAAIAIIVDTSASQVGDYRKDQLASLEGILSGLRAGDTVQIFASDVAPLRCRSQSMRRIKKP